MTGNITIEDHNNRYHVTDITAVQQQPEDLKFTRNLTKVIDKIIG